MKERLSLKDIFFVLSSLISPFRTVTIRPLKGMAATVENVPDSKAPSIESATINEKGMIVVPKGASVRVINGRKESRAQFRVEEYRGRTGHTPGAKITGEGVDVDLNSKNNKVFIPEIGYIEYKK